MVCQDLRSRPWRDADEDMDREYVMHTELGDLVRAFDGVAPDKAFIRLAWLSMFAARRALPCWDLYCDGRAPHEAVLAVREWLLTGVAPRNWKPHTKPGLPAYRGKRIVDCRECDTGSAASSAAQAARFAASRDPFNAVCALSDAHTAFDQSLLGRSEEFDRWLLDVAVPAAYDCRELTSEERVAFRWYDDQQVRPQEEKRT